jgi:hypothetical protein
MQADIARLGWVGFAENDENDTVLPILSAGYDEDFVIFAAKIFRRIPLCPAGERYRNSEADTALL